MSYLQNNLETLRAVMPQVAARVEAAAVPEGFAEVEGTDGTRTFSRVVVSPKGKRRVEWLGGTSMPRASAGAIIESLDAVSGGQNGLGLSIGTGYEWAAFAGKLSRGGGRQMVYVYEPEAGVLRMALTVCDLAQWVASCRVVLLTGTAEEAGEELSRFLCERDGLEVPAVLHPLPTLDGERRNAMLAAGEAMVRRVVIERQEMVARLWQRVEAACAAARGDEVREVAFLVRERYAAERPLHAEVARAGKGGGMRSVWVDRHATASVARRLRVLAEEMEQAKTHVRIKSDLFRGELGALPAGVGRGVETWVPPLAGAGYWQRVVGLAGGMGPADRVVVHFGGHVEKLLERGVARGQVEVRALRPGDAVPVAHASGHRGCGQKHGPRDRVALIGDLAPTDAASLGVELPTHQAVFAAASEVVREDYLSVHPGMAADVLRRALGRAGIEAKAADEALTEPLLRAIREVLIPSLPPLVLAGELAAQGVAVTLIGDWPGAEKHVRGDVRIVPFEAYAGGVWDEVAVLVQHSPEGTFSPLLWEAVGAGVALVAVSHSSDKQEGALAQLLEADKQYVRAAGNVVGAVKGLLRDAARRQRLVEGARRMLE